MSIQGFKFPQNVYFLRLNRHFEAKHANHLNFHTIKTTASDSDEELQLPFVVGPNMIQTNPR